MKPADTPLPRGVDVPFSQIESTLARLLRDGQRRRRVPLRALTATVVVVGDAARLAEAADALDQLGESGGVRAVLISEGTETAPAARVTEHAIGLAGLAPRFLNNAVAALRLSSLPTLVWWRGGLVHALDDVARLADRLVLDVDSPDEVWTAARAYYEVTAVTALRWTRLTRWRALLAHLFELPEVRDAAREVTRLTIDAPDPHAARLFAGWLQSTLGFGATTDVRVRQVDGDARMALESAILHTAAGLAVRLRVAPTRTCLAAAIDGSAGEGAARVVPFGDLGLTALIGQELGIRARDATFERALSSAMERTV